MNALDAVIDSDLDPNTSQIAEVYARFVVRENSSTISCSVGWIAWLTKRSDTTVRDAIRQLRKIGFLEWVGTDLVHKTNLYHVHPEVLNKRTPFVPKRDGRPPKEVSPADTTFAKEVAQLDTTFTETEKVVSQGAPKEDSGAEAEYREDSESISFRNSAELEKLSSCPSPDSVLPITVSGSDVVKQHEAGALHNAIPATAQVFAEMFPEPAPPVKEKSSKAANAKSAPPPKPKKEPKPPRELDPREAEFLAQVEQLDPFMGKQVESRLRKYRRDKPWSALQVYLLTGKPVPPASLQAVTSLNGTAFDTELMLKCLSAWTSKGWSPMNLAWLLEWYKAGGPPQYGKYGQQTQQPAPVVAKSDAELEAENDKHNAEVLAFHEWLVSTGRDTRTGYNAITRAGAAVSNVDLPYYDQEKLWYAEYQAEQ